MRRAAGLALALVFCGPFAALADEPYAFTKNDRILIVAPHPDDETLGAAGAILAARRSGAPVKVLYLTHGDYNELASLAYLKKPMLLKPDFIRTGNVREEEAEKAMALLGMANSDDCLFLGYPDFGMLKIWLKHWDSAKPFRSFFSRINKVPYEQDVAYGQYYRGENVVRNIEHVLMEFEPTTVFVTPPFDRHPDHQAAYLYLRVALFDLEGEVPAPRVYEYLVHASRWPENRKYDPSAPLDAPGDLESVSGVKWLRFSVPEEDRGLKEKAISEYKSQFAYSKSFLQSFVRENELAAVETPEEVPYEPGTEFAAPAAEPEKGDVTYRFNDKELLVTVPLSKPFDEIGTLTTYVHAYKKGYPFAEMPKLSVRLFGKKLFVSDGPRAFYDPGIVFRIKGRLMELRVPLRVLKYPDALFVSTRNAAEEMSLDFGSWKVLTLQKPAIIGAK